MGVVQPVFTADKRFTRAANARDSLNLIKNLLAEDDEMAWAMRTPHMTVQFAVGTTLGGEDAYGTTQLLIGDTDMLAMNLRNPQQVLDLLGRGSKLKVKITIDQSILDNQGLTYITLAHEIGAHLKPRVKFLRNVVERGVALKDLHALLTIVEGEHAGVYHTRTTAPKNPMYFMLAAAFASVAPEGEGKRTFVDHYYNDVARYSPEEEGAPSIVAIMGQARLQQQAAQRLLLQGAGVLAVVAAILIGLYFKFGSGGQGPSS
jgi:hypothetical protein